MRLVDSDTHHWEGMEPHPYDMYGFIYEIVNKINGRRYIGRKFYWKYKKRKRYAENDWHYYTGSSSYLTKDLKKFGKENFTFTIIDEYKTRGGVVFGETEWLVLSGVLTKKLPDGSGRMYYNKSIGGIRFVPNEFHTEETIAKISGPNNHRYDGTIHHWYNKFNGIEEKLPTRDMIVKYSLDKSHMYDVVQDIRPHHAGWCLYDKRNDFHASKVTIGETLTITNGVETHTGTQKELVEKLKLDSAAVSRLKSGQYKTTKGWKLKK